MSEQRDLEIFLSDWPSLRPHFTRGALFVVDSSLNLRAICEAVAQDNKKLIEKWMSENLLRRPTTEEDALWSSEPTPEFEFGIVQPYVFIQATHSNKH